MKTNADVARGLIAKARGDLLAMDVTLRAGALDPSCFHAQQAAEKMLKGFLVVKDRDYPFTHNIEKLLEIAAAEDPSFLKFLSAGKKLTPYAVELRYDHNRSATLRNAKEACRMAGDICQFVFERLPTRIRGLRPR